jgi:Protein of unknown function (DUF4238)
MSIPLNHHHVSRCQIKEFFNENGKIFLYDKAKKIFSSKTSSKNIFSEKLSNSVYKNGKIDHTTLENDLKIFEDSYPKDVDLIRNAVKEKQISKECHYSLLNITLLGIIGRLRTPARKKELDNILDKMFGQLEPHITDELLKEFEETNEYKKHVKYSNMLGYAETALRIAEKMGGLDFTIWHIQSEDCFLLPDTSATTTRRKINEYFNPDIQEIAEVGFPLTQKIFVHALSKKLGQGQSVVVTVKKNNHQAIIDINHNLFHHSNNLVATSNESYLKHFVSLTKGEPL